MSYKTNPKALRLGISSNWTYKSHGPSPNLHLDHKLASYVTNLVEYVVPQAPQRAKTKGRYLRHFSASPGIQGKTLVLRGEDRIHLVIYFYLNLNGADDRQRRSLHRNLGHIAWLLTQDSGYRVELVALNYFVFFWRMRLFTGRRIYRKLRSRVKRCISRHSFLRRERLCYTAYAYRVRRIRRAVRSFRRERYFGRTFYPMVAAFLSEEFDGDMAAKTIALELQILRVYHRRFMRYIRRLMTMGFHHWHRTSLLEGMRVEVRGRMTDYRRQVRRAQTKSFRFGTLKKGFLRVEAGHCRHLAYNRYGVISVSILHQTRPVEGERWEDRTLQTPLRAFSLRETLEDWAEGADTPLPPSLSLRHPTYEMDPLAVVDNHRRMEYLWGRRREGKLGEKEGAELAQQPPLELVNRFVYYRERLRWRAALHSRPHRAVILLRPYRLTEGTAYSQTHHFPLDRGRLAPFQLQLQRLQQLGQRLRQGLPRRGAEIPPTPPQRWGATLPVAETAAPFPRTSPLLTSSSGSHPWRRQRRRSIPDTSAPW
jgi:hypothetical protein